CTQMWKQGLHAVGGLNDVGARLALDVQDDGRRLVNPGGEANVLDVINDIADVAEADGHSVLVCDDEIGVFGRGQKLIVGADGIGEARAVEISFGRIHVIGDETVANVFETDAKGGKSGRVDLNTNGGLLVAFNSDQSNTADFAQFLGQ